jgi:hypothetical protein
LHLYSDNSDVSESATTDVGLEVGTAILVVELVSLFCCGPSFSSFFSTRCHVVETGQQAGTLGFDDGDREASTELIEDETSFIVRDWTAI